MNTLASTAAVLVTWAVVGAVVWGCGHAARRLLVVLLGARASSAPCFADVWTGVAVVTVYLLVSSLSTAIDGRAWLGPAVAGIVGWVLAATARPETLPRPSLFAFVVVAALAALLANLSLGDTTAYDTGLYHQAVIDQSSSGAAMPGVGNLHIRLSSAAAHLLFVAFVGVGPWHGSGQHVANGFLLVLLLLQLVVLASVRGSAARAMLTRRVSILLVPATAIVVVADPMGRVSSPSLDIAALVLVVAGVVLLTRAAELGWETSHLVAAGGALGAGLATRPQIAPALLAGTIVLGLRTDRISWASRALVFWVLPLACLLAAAARQTVLSGYPFFPLSFPSLDVDWRVDPAAVESYREVVESWARHPGDVDGAGLGNWGWLWDWSGVVATDIDVAPVIALVVLALVGWVVVWRRRIGATDSVHAAALLLPPLAMVLLWFVTAPDTRFAYGAIMLLGLGTVACLTPAPTLGDLRSLVPVVALTCVALGTSLWSHTRLVETSGGIFPPRRVERPSTRAYVTDSGLVLQVPVEGDRCWGVVLCTPTPNPGLELRGSSPADGFRIAPS